MHDVAIPIRSKRFSKTEFFFLVFLGTLIGVAAQFMPWGNGFTGFGMSAGSIVSILITYALTRRLTTVRRWPRYGIAALVTAIVASYVGYKTAWPDPRPTLSYMVKGTLPDSVQVDLVRCQWLDGQTYVARFIADQAAFNQILSYRKYEAQEIDLTKMRYQSAFYNAASLERYMNVPVLKSPQWFQFSSGQNVDGGRSDEATIVWDANTHQCWLLYIWT